MEFFIVVLLGYCGLCLETLLKGVGAYGRCWTGSLTAQGWELLWKLQVLGCFLSFAKVVATENAIAPLIARVLFFPNKARKKLHSLWASKRCQHLVTTHYPTQVSFCQLFTTVAAWPPWEIPNFFSCYQQLVGLGCVCTDLMPSSWGCPYGLSSLLCRITVPHKSLYWMV